MRVDVPEAPEGGGEVILSIATLYLATLRPVRHEPGLCWQERDVRRGVVLVCRDRRVE